MLITKVARCDNVWLGGYICMTRKGLSEEVRLWYSLMAQMVKNLLAMQETQVQSPGQEDPLEKGMATHSSILA